jgi:D-lactate dehydrogenase
MKIALYSSKSYDQDYFERENKSFNYEIAYYEGSLKPSSVKLAVGFDVVCAFVNDKINRETLTNLHEIGVKLIALRCAGFNNLDLQAADELNIKVMRVPAYSPHAVAEHTVALILSLNRKIHKAYNRVRDNNFSLERLEGFDVYNKTVGVIGTGNIGSVFANIMKGFGCKVLAYDIHKNSALTDIGVEYVDLPSLFMNSDIVSLHCPLNPSTAQIINRNTLGMMKKGSMLINTSRGKLINTADVIEALKTRHLGYLGIDVYAEEERIFFKDLSERIIDDELISRLMTFPNVLITAHQAFMTHEALEQIARTTLNNISDFSKGIRNGNEVSYEEVKPK